MWPPARQLHVRCGRLGLRQVLFYDDVTCTALISAEIPPWLFHLKRQIRKKGYRCDMSLLVTITDDVLIHDTAFTDSPPLPAPQEGDKKPLETLVALHP